MPFNTRHNWQFSHACSANMLLALITCIKCPHVFLDPNLCACVSPFSHIAEYKKADTCVAGVKRLLQLYHSLFLCFIIPLFVSLTEPFHWSTFHLASVLKCVLRGIQMLAGNEQSWSEILICSFQFGCGPFVNYWTRCCESEINVMFVNFEILMFCVSLCEN